MTTRDRATRMGHGHGDAQLALPLAASHDAAPSRVPSAGNEARAARLVLPHPARIGAIALLPTASNDRAQDTDTNRLLLTVPEAAHLLHIGRRQAWEMVWRGELPVVRLGRSVRIARPVLERFVTERSLPYGA